MPIILGILLLKIPVKKTMNCSRVTFIGFVILKHAWPTLFFKSNNASLKLESITNSNLHYLNSLCNTTFQFFGDLTSFTNNTCLTCIGNVND
jgi:hypothetical protein